MELTRFTVGRIYAGNSLYKGLVLVEIIKKTPSMVYYKLDTGETGRTKVYIQSNSEVISIAKHGIRCFATDFYD